MYNNIESDNYSGYFQGERYQPVDKFSDSYVSIRERSSEYSHKRLAESKLKPRLRTPKQSRVSKLQIQPNNSTSHLLSFSLNAYYNNLAAVFTVLAFLVTLLLMFKIFVLA